jgi:hypothetical protein
VPTRMATLNNLHYLCADETRASTPEFVDNYLLFVNHSKNCYIDKSKVSGDIHGDGRLWHWRSSWSQSKFPRKTGS